jgi:DNA-binding NtrC family response regulator
VFGPDYAYQAKILESRVLDGEIIETEQTLIYKDRSITFNFVRFPMRDPAGSIIGVCGIARDVTERRQREIVPGEQTARYSSAPMQETLSQVRRAAKTESIVLFLGESGSGKDYLARYLHESSNRAGGPFFTINCAALAPELVESELFGHEPGAFTGSHGRKRGLLELAEGGTLLLNEIGELQPKLQSKLLTFLDTQTFIRVGGEKDVTVNARLIAATNRDLEQEVKQGNFREDLFYRLNVFCIRVPPLRERREDLPFILDDLLIILSRQMGLGRVPRIDEAAMEVLLNYRWPGNVREARNVLERALILCDKRKISAKDLSITEKPEVRRLTADELSVSLSLAPGSSMHEALLDAKRRLVEEALGRSRGSIKGAAILLGISRDSFVHHMKSLGVRR